MGRARMPGLINRGGIWHIDKRFRRSRLRESTGECDLAKADEPRQEGRFSAHCRASPRRRRAVRKTTSDARWIVHAGPARCDSRSAPHEPMRHPWATGSVSACVTAAWRIIRRSTWLAYRASRPRSRSRALPILIRSPAQHRVRPGPSAQSCQFWESRLYAACGDRPGRRSLRLR